MYGVKNVGVCVYKYKMNIGIKVNLINACKVILQPKTKLNKHKKKWKSILHTENGACFKKVFFTLGHNGHLNVIFYDFHLIIVNTVLLNVSQYKYYSNKCNKFRTN